MTCVWALRHLYCCLMQTEAAEQIVGKQMPENETKQFLRKNHHLFNLIAARTHSR